MAKRIYNVDSPIKFGGEQYHPDNKDMNTIELPTKEAENLLAVNAISVPDEIKKETPTDKKTNVVNLQTAPEENAERITAIKEAIGQLDKKDESHWTKNNEPDANVLTEMLGWKVKAEERDQAWMEILESAGQG